MTMIISAVGHSWRILCWLKTMHADFIIGIWWRRWRHWHCCPANDCMRPGWQMLRTRQSPVTTHHRSHWSWRAYDKFRANLGDLKPHSWVIGFTQSDCNLHMFVDIKDQINHRNDSMVSKGSFISIWEETPLRVDTTTMNRAITDITDRRRQTIGHA